MANRGRARHVFHAIALVVGAVALAVLVDQLGWAGLRRVILGTGAWFAVLAVIDLASVCCDAGGIYSFLRPHAPVRYGRVLVAQASGLAINRLTPANSMGEAVKVTMLVEHVPRTAAVSAVVMFNLATIWIAIAAIVVGVPLTLLVLELPPRVQLVVWIATGVLAGLALGLFALVRRGAIATLIAAPARLGLLAPARAARWRAKVADIDATVQQFGRPGARLGIAFVLGSRALNWAGTVVVMIAADIPLTAPLVLAMLSVGILITWLSNVIPLGLGLADGTNYALYGVLGSSGPVGLVFTMINRARTVVLALLGLTIMLIADLADRARPGG